MCAKLIFLFSSHLTLRSLWFSESQKEGRQRTTATLTRLKILAYTQSTMPRVPKYRRRNANVDRWLARRAERPSEKSAYPPTPRYQPSFGSVTTVPAPVEGKLPVQVPTRSKRKNEDSYEANRKRWRGEANWYYDNILAIDRSVVTTDERVKAYKLLKRKADRSEIEEHVDKWRRLNFPVVLEVRSGVSG